MHFNKINHALIMAAGRGMRMKPLTNALPKPMAPFLDSTLIGNGIDKIKNHISDIHITVGYKGAMLAKHVIENNVSSIFNTEGKGNSWWLFNTLMKNLNEPCYVLTSDNVIELDFQKINADYYNLGNPACMVVPVKPIPGLDGDYIFEENSIITELNRNKPSEKYCSGIQVINPFKINKLIKKSESFYDVWTQLIAINELKCSKIYPEKWYAVDTLQQLFDLENQYNKLTQ